MEHADTNITEKDYLQGALLAQALFKFGSPELIHSYQLLQKPIQPRNKPGSKGFLNAMQMVGSGLLEIQTQQIKQKEIYSQLKTQIMDLIKSGELIACGYSLPRNLKDNPTKIPTDLFFSGAINWELSELEFKNIGFSGIRLIKNADLNNMAQLKQADQPKSDQIHKSSFAELDPSLHISEKEAAHYLGISPRTLQGYRIKGGGPPYRKLNKTVRYKVADLIQWSEASKKLNTI